MFRAKTTSVARPGQTLLEVIAATSMMAIALVPSLRMMRDGIAQAGNIETRNLLSTLAVSKLEEYLAATAGNWATTSASGNFSALGYASIRYTVTRSDQVASGGLPDQLMAISVTVWSDENSDSALGAGEPSTTYRSKLAKLSTYL